MSLHNLTRSKAYFELVKKITPLLNWQKKQIKTLMIQLIASVSEFQRAGFRMLFEEIIEVSHLTKTQ